jgi:STE24 endopeptidase
LRPVCSVQPVTYTLGFTNSTPPDAFAQNLGYSDKLASSLLKLQIQNLSTMDADPIYASYHYSHPILTERLAALGWKGGKVTSNKEEDSEKPVKAADREL